MNVWPDERVAQLRRLWGAGQTAKTIADQLGVSRSAVLGKLCRIGLMGRRENIPEENRADIMRARPWDPSRDPKPESLRA